MPSLRHPTQSALSRGRDARGRVVLSHAVRALVRRRDRTLPSPCQQKHSRTGQPPNASLRPAMQARTRERHTSADCGLPLSTRTGEPWRSPRPFSLPDSRSRRGESKLSHLTSKQLVSLSRAWESCRQAHALRRWSGSRAGPSPFLRNIFNRRRLAHGTAAKRKHPALRRRSFGRAFRPVRAFSYRAPLMRGMFDAGGVSGAGMTGAFLPTDVRPVGPHALFLTESFSERG